MVEMRWFQKKMRYPDQLVDLEDHYWVKVLQFRELETHTTWHGKAGGIRKKVWGEWQDVPTVIDPTSNSVSS